MEKAQIEALNNLLKREVLTEEEKKALRALMEGEIHTATINKIAFDRKSAPEENARFCLDFGTAFSKAWATGRDVGEALPLVLGEIAGDEGLIVPSSIYIAKNGRVYIGREAETQHRADVRPGRVRFDNLKRMLTEAEIRTELHAIPLREGIDPTGSGLTGGDLLVVYLAWLTDLAEDALSNAIRATDGRFSLGEFDPRGVKRRFALLASKSPLTK